MKILIASAFDAEQTTIKEKLSSSSRKTIQSSSITLETQSYKNHQIYFVSTGIGTVCAGVVAGSLFQTLQPDVIIFAGTAGGLNGVKIGDIVIGKMAMDVDIWDMHDAIKNTPFESVLTNPINHRLTPKIYEPDVELLKLATEINVEHAFPVHVGMIGTTNYFPAPAFMFDFIKQQQILALDMESSAIYQAAWMLNRKALVIRGISNLLNDKGEDENIHEAEVDRCANNLADYLLHFIDALNEYPCALPEERGVQRKISAS